jgi:hypothetical protein
MFFVRFIMILVRDLVCGTEVEGNSAPKCPPPTLDLRSRSHDELARKAEPGEMQAVAWSTC